MKKVKGIIVMLLFFLFLGGPVVYASTEDSYWGYLNRDKVAYTKDRYKDTKGNIYCYPEKGGNVYVTVQKMSNLNNSYSKKVKLENGKQYTIVNSAGKDCYVRLKFNASVFDSTVNSGHWSPDASKDYNIVGR